MIILIVINLYLQRYKKIFIFYKQIGQEFSPARFVFL